MFESGRPLTYIRSAEEQRVGKVLREVALRLSDSTPAPVWTWTLTEGMHRDGQEAEAGTHAARGALDFIAAQQGVAIFHLKDFHEPLRESPEIRRRLRDLYESCRDQRKFVVISSPVRSIPEEVERSLMFLELRPPDLIELLDFLREESGETSETILQPVAQALQGSAYEAERERVKTNVTRAVNSARAAVGAPPGGRFGLVGALRLRYRTFAIF